MVNYIILALNVIMAGACFYKGFIEKDLGKAAPAAIMFWLNIFAVIANWTNLL